MNFPNHHPRHGYNPGKYANLNVDNLQAQYRNEVEAFVKGIRDVPVDDLKNQRIKDIAEFIKAVLPIMTLGTTAFLIYQNHKNTTDEEYKKMAKSEENAIKAAIANNTTTANLFPQSQQPTRSMFNNQSMGRQMGGFNA